MLGVAFLMLLGVEAAYRVQADLRSLLRSVSGSRPPRSAYTEYAWYPAYEREYRESSGEHWKPFVHFRRRYFSGSLINVDSSGHRRTTAEPREARDTVRVFFFGGSAVWGSFLRDPATIPSIVEQRLRRSAAAGVTYDVTNFGESGYVSTQGLLELEMELRARRIPDIVVFMDGFDDVAAAAQDASGLPQNEFNRSREFEFGRVVYGPETTVRSDARAVRAIGNAIAQRFQLVQRLRVAFATPVRPRRSVEQAANELVTLYAENVRLLEALGRTYGFRTVYVWQPSLHTTTKKLTAYERLILSEIGNSGFQSRLMAIHRAINPKLDSAITTLVGSRFIDETSLFAGDSSSVFVDNVGDNTEQSIPRIVDGFYPELASLVETTTVERRHAGKTAGRGGQ